MLPDVSSEVVFYLHDDASKEDGSRALDGYCAYDPPVALAKAPFVVIPTLPARPQLAGFTNPDAALVTTSIAALPAVTASGSEESELSTQKSPVDPRFGVNHGSVAVTNDEAVPAVGSDGGLSSSINIGEFITSGMNTAQATHDDNAGFTSSIAVSVAVGGVGLQIIHSRTTTCPNFESIDHRNQAVLLASMDNIGVQDIPSKTNALPAVVIKRLKPKWTEDSYNSGHDLALCPDSVNHDNPALLTALTALMPLCLAADLPRSH